MNLRKDHYRRSGRRPRGRTGGQSNCRGARRCRWGPRSQPPDARPKASQPTERDGAARRGGGPGPALPELGMARLLGGGPTGLSRALGRGNAGCPGQSAAAQRSVFFFVSGFLSRRAPGPAARVLGRNAEHTGQSRRGGLAAPRVPSQLALPPPEGSGGFNDPGTRAPARVDRGARGSSATEKNSNTSVSDTGRKTKQKEYNS